MPQFTVWNVPSPFPNVLFDPGKIDAQNADTQYKLGTLGLNREQFEFDKQMMLDSEQQARRILGSNAGGAGATTAYPAPGAANGTGAGGSFLGALARIESGDQNIVSGTDKDSRGLTLAQGGDPSEISQGHFQVQTATWRDFAPRAGVDVNQYPNAMSAPRDVQARVASVIPFSRFGPRTQALMHQRFGDFDPNQTVGTLAGLGPRVAPAAPGVSSATPSALAAGSGGHDDPASVAAVRQASTSLLAMPENEAAAAYPGVVRDLQQRGLAMNAPPTYPGHAALQMLVGGQGMPTPPVPPTVTGDANGDVAPAAAEPSRLAMRLGGVDAAGPAAPTGTPTVPPSFDLMPGAVPNSLMRPAAPAQAPATAQAAAPAPSPTQIAPPPSQAAPMPRTGMNSPQFQAAMELQRKAAALDMLYDKTGRWKAVAADLRSQAALMLQADSVTYDQTGIGTKAVTGEQVSAAKGRPTWVFDPNAGGPGIGGYIDTTGGNKPEIVPAQRADAAAQQMVLTLGPQIAALQAAGRPVPAQMASDYATAMETFRHPEKVQDPISKQEGTAYTRGIPGGLPVPRGMDPGSGFRPLTQGLSPSQQQIERDPAAYKVSENQYDRDSKEIPAIGDAGRQAQADQVRIKEMQDVLQRFSTGPGTEWRTAASAFLQRWLPSAVSGWEKQSADLSGADAAQAFIKMALVGAGTQERSVLGARGGYQAIKLFKEANPNVNLQDATNKAILDMQLISNQANQDYSQAALTHFADNEKKFAGTHQYDSLAQFDRAWNAQRNPEVYAAAMGAVSGQPPERWSKGLSDTEYQRVLELVSRAAPNAIVNARSGRISMQPGGQSTQGRPPPPDVGAVQGGYRFKGGDPAIPSSWEPVR